MPDFKKIWDKSKKFALAALFTGSLYTYLYPQTIEHYNYTSQVRMIDNYQELTRSENNFKNPKLIDKYNNSVDIFEGDLSNLNSIEKIIEYNRKYDISKFALIYLISLMLTSAVYKSTNNKSPLKHLSKLVSDEHKYMRSKKKNNLEDKLNSENNLSKSFFENNRTIFNATKENLNLSESVQNVYEFEKRKYKKNFLSDVGLFISQNIVGFPVHLALNLIKSRQSNPRELLRTIYFDEHLYKTSQIIPYHKLFWNRLHKLNSNVGLYALEAIFYKNKNPNRANFLWDKLIDELSSQGLENNFHKIGDFRNEVFDFSLGDLNFVLKKSKEKKNLQIEYDNLKKMSELENVVVPLKLFEHNSNYFLMTMFEKSMNLFDYVKYLPLDEKISLLQQSTINMNQIHDSKKVSKGLDDILSNDKNYFLNRIDLVSDKLNLPEMLKSRLFEGFVSISEKLYEIYDNPELSNLLLKIYGDMNPRNFLITEKDSRIEQKLCDFESNYRLPVLFDYISLWEFERMYIHTEIVTENILNNIVGNNQKLRDKIEPYIDIARVQRHWELIGYRNRDFNKNIDALNNITYEFYHKAMAEEALNRLVKSGYDELILLEKVISDLDPFEYFV